LIYAAKIERLLETVLPEDAIFICLVGGGAGMSGSLKIPAVRRSTLAKWSE
jgi:hypothetical protein